jgi:hypothetical protein
MEYQENKIVMVPECDYVPIQEHTGLKKRLAEAEKLLSDAVNLPDGGCGAIYPPAMLLRGRAKKFLTPTLPTLAPEIVSESGKLIPNTWMTPEQTQDLCDWSAKKMGYSIVGMDDDGNLLAYKKDEYKGEEYEYFCIWRPDNPETGQIWQFIERMIDLGYELRFCGPVGPNYSYSAEFIDGKEVIDPNPCLGILLAAKATEEVK